jgi:hypothetical protein
MTGIWGGPLGRPITGLLAERPRTCYPAPGSSKLLTGR